MSDRGAQHTFSEVFRLLASDPSEQHVGWAKKLWKLSGQFDSYPGDWECDKALITLGLAKRGLDPDYPEDGERTLYQGLDYGRR